MSRSPRPGDWVRARRTLQVSFTDRMLGPDAGLKRGSEGVVLERDGRHLSVQFASGWGPVTARVAVEDCVVSRRGGGAGAFDSRTRRRTAARLGLAIVLSWPVLQFVVTYLWHHGTADGLAGELALAVLSGAGDLLIAAMQEPARTVVYCIVLATLSKLAFAH